MAVSWDRKGISGLRYFYRTERRGKRVVKTYVGRGSEGLAAARHDEKVRRQRQVDRRHWEEILCRHEQGRERVDALLAPTRLLMRSVLVVNGFYQHHGSEWRRRGKRIHG